MRSGGLRRLELGAVFAVLALAAWLRLRDLDLAEFKLDEATAVDLARRVLDGHLPTVGLTASIGVRDPPFFAYLMAIPLGLRDDPLVATAFVGVLATIAIAITYHVLRARFGSLAELGTVVLFATAPWAVVYGRKIWPQNVLPVVSVLLLWALFLVLERSRTRTVLFVPVLLCLAFQLNFSALALVVPAAAVVACRARNVHWPALGAGVVVAILLLGPWLGHEAAHGFEDVTGILTQGRGNRGSSLLGSGSVRAVRETVHIAGASGWDYIVGSSHGRFVDEAGRAWTAGRLSNFLTAALLLVGLVTSTFHVLRGARRRVGLPWVSLELRSARRALLLAWLGGIWLSYVASAPGRMAPHYLIATYPVSFAFEGLAVSDLARGLAGRLRGNAGLVASLAAPGVLAIAAVSYVAYTVSFHRYLDHVGGAVGDYGVVYRDKSALARAVRERGLHVANEPSIEFLVTGRIETAPSRPLVVVRNTLRNSAPLPCPEPPRSFGVLRACLPNANTDAAG